MNPIADIFLNRGRNHKTAQEIGAVAGQIAGMAQSANPMQLLAQMAQNNPNLADAQRLIQSGRSVEQVARMMIQQQGYNPDEFLSAVRNGIGTNHK